MGRNNSGLSDADVADVMCILHPCSPAAFNVVATTAQRTPQYVLQNNEFQHFEDDLTPSALEEEKETFILPTDSSSHAMDLALRFSAPAKDPNLGFVFGRNAAQCDIVLATDTGKRVSNVHFSIYINEMGVLLVHDWSTNGTLVDEIILKGKVNNNQPQTHMINSGSIIQILSPKQEEIVKFIVRLPNREGYTEQYEANFQAHMQAKRAAEARAAAQGRGAERPIAPRAKTQALRAPLIHNPHGMQWSGGDKYNVVGHIGKGAFATVYQLATKSDGQLYAAKELEKRKFMKNGIIDRKLDNEMKIMASISHPNIVKYIDYVDHDRHMYIIMEFVPCGDLQKYLQMYKAMQEDLAKTMAEQVLDALAYLHRMKITHRDIKPDNILLATLDPSDFVVKLSDFGLSKVVPDNETFLKTFCGTLLYCAPEVFPHYDAHVAGKGNKRPRKSAPHQQSAKMYHSYSQTVDIWSFGAVLWYSLCLTPPFEGVADNTGRGMFDKIMMTPLDTTDLVKQGVSDDAVALLIEMLNTDPSTRPSPASCLRHQWFGRTEQQQAVTGAVDEGLVSIAEDIEGEEDPDFSNLSLDELDSNQNSQTSELSIHSNSFEFFDPRQSKRFKADTHAYREPDDGMESSPELFHQSIHIMHQPESRPTAATQPVQSARPKLFGEISQSALGGARAFDFASTAPARSGSPARDAPNDPTATDESENGQNPGALASPSLLGAESMVRDLNMDSPHSANTSQGADSNGPAEPRTPGQVEVASPEQASANDITPKPQQRAIFNRQINIPIPASFYFDAADLTTHTLEYASKQSGFDYISNPSYIKEAGELSLPGTMSGSAEANEPTDDETEESNNNAAPSQQAVLPHSASISRQIVMPPPTAFVKPPPRLGRLTSTADSFAQITLNISTRMMQWGRGKGNTHQYLDLQDTRIAKIAILIYHHSKDMDKVPEDDQSWMHLPDLHCLLRTESSLGLTVNGVPLKKAAENTKAVFGRVYTGDEITVVHPNERTGAKGLTFVCEFFHGEGRLRRPEGAPPFKKESGKIVAKPKGKEKAPTGVESVAAPAVS